MINDTYVDCDIAIKLKEKGFNEPCSTWWRKSDGKDTFENAVDRRYIWKYQQIRI
jgi:hypothetical protein